MSSLSSRMHRLVKKIDRMEQPRSYSRDTSPASEFSAAAAIARMAGKKKGAENISLQIEVETEVQWKALLRREGLIVVDVYASWAGPCSSMISILKRIKVEVNEDRLWLATACSDNISELMGFKDESEPTWLFMAAGKPVKVFRGSNAPKLTNLIKSELKNEIKCLQGKAKRNFIHIDDEVGRRRKAEAEALKLAAIVKDEDAAAEKLNSLRRESSTRLMNSLEPYTILVIQNFLLETGAVTEVRDYLIGEFKIEQERYVHLDEEGVRKLFRIPHEIPDPNQPAEPTEIFFPDPTPPPELEPTPSVDGEPGEAATEAAAEASRPVSPAPKPKKMIPIECPDSIKGNTLIMLLECVEVKDMLKAGVQLDAKNPLKSADDYIQIKVGPIKLEDAQEHAPDSLHALYGKGGYEYGVWCPRRYDDKRYVMINFFPGFVTEMLMPQGDMEPKYRVAIFQASKADAIPNELKIHNKSVLGQRTVKLPKDVVEAMLASEANKGEAYQEKKKALEAKEVYAVSVDRRNSDIMLTLKSQEPIHISVDQKAGRFETAKLFAALNISLPSGTDAEVKKFLGRGPSRLGENEQVVETHKAPAEPPVEEKESENFE